MSVVLLNFTNLCVAILTEITFHGFSLSNGGHLLRDLAQNVGNQTQAIDITYVFADNICRRGRLGVEVKAQHAAPLHRDDGCCLGRPGRAPLVHSRLPAPECAPRPHASTARRA